MVFQNSKTKKLTEVEIPQVPFANGETERADFVTTEKLERMLAEMVQDHAIGRDLFLV